MARNYIQPGKQISFVNTSGETVLSGDVIAFDSFIAVAMTNIGVGETGTASVEGVWELPKSAAAFEIGTDVHWSGDQIVKTATNDTTPAGYVFEAADAAADVVRVKLKG